MTQYVQNNNISRRLASGYVMTSDLIGRWNTVLDTLSNKHIVEHRGISPAVAEKYKGDMYGMFRELGIPDSHIYPHIRVNGYLSSMDYYGEILVINILDNSVLEQYIRLFLLKEK
jgi:hypothetical protein